MSSKSSKPSKPSQPTPPQPYRESPEPSKEIFPDATDGEVAFWDTLMLTMLGTGEISMKPDATTVADDIFQARRRRFGIRNV